MLKPFTGTLLFLAVAAPWHILCGIYNPDQGHPIGNHPTLGNVHGFFYFYFINEHVLRFFGQRYPHDYNKMPGSVYWLAHLVWLFPWSIFLPAAIFAAWKTRRNWMQHLNRDAGRRRRRLLSRQRHPRRCVASYVSRLKFRVRTIWLLALFSAWTLLFFSISTNQEYYTFPVWTPLFILIAGVVAGIEENRAPNGTPDGTPSLLSTKWLTAAQAFLAVIGVASAITLCWGLWVSCATCPTCPTLVPPPPLVARRRRLHALHGAPCLTPTPPAQSFARTFAPARCASVLIAF